MKRPWHVVRVSAKSERGRYPDNESGLDGDIGPTVCEELSLWE